MAGKKEGFYFKLTKVDFLWALISSKSGRKVQRKENTKHVWKMRQFMIIKQKRDEGILIFNRKLMKSFSPKWKMCFITKKMRIN